MEVVMQVYYLQLLTLTSLGFFEIKKPGGTKGPPSINPEPVKS